MYYLNAVRRVRVSRVLAAHGRRAAAVLTGLAGLLPLAPAAAQVTNWNVAGGSWLAAGNWTPTGVPTASHNVRINNGGVCTLNDPVFVHAADVFVNGGSTFNLMNGQLNTASEFVVGSAGTSGTANVSGVWNVAGGAAWVGLSGNGTLTIDGGFVNSGFSNVGFNSGVSGQVTVRDSGRWDCTNLTIGYSGSGLVQVENGSILNVPTITLATNPGSFGTLRIGGSGTQPDVGTGIVQGGAGDAVVEFQHSMSNYPFARQLQGNLRVVHASNGSTALTGSNSYDGGTTLYGGFLIVSADANLGSGAVTFDGGALRTTTNTTINRQFSVADGNGTLNVTAGTLTYDGFMNGSGIMAKTGAGTLLFDGFANMDNEFWLLGGTTNCDGDILTAGIHVGDTGAVALNITNALVQPRNFLIVGGNLDSAGPGANGTLTIGNGGYVRMDSVGNTPLTVGGVNATGTVNLNAGGTLQVRGADAIRKEASGTANFNFAGGKLLAINQATTSSLPMTLSGTTATVEQYGNTLTLSGPLTGSGALTKIGSDSTLILSSSATNYTGATAVSEGTLEITNNVNFNSPFTWPRAVRCR